MTVTYTHEVANSRLGGFSNLLLRWRGSVYKLFYKEFIIYVTLYTIISIVYRSVGTTEFRQSFEKLCLQFQNYTDLVPISFVLGFYVSMVVGRWWCQYENIPWPDRLMVLITSNVHGSDSRGRLIRRTLLRYVNLSQVLTYRSISTAVYKRFPTIQHVIDAGFMTETEHRQYENVKTKNVKYWVPCVWFANLLCKVRQEGRIYDDMTYQAMLQEMNTFRGCCGMLFSYDWISIPLVYTQVVTVAVYVYFMSTLLSRQYLDVTKEYPGHEVDLYVPIFTICQFLFYVGWLKVAEQLINPFGEDDDDFEVNSIIDRNFEISMLAVDNMYMTHPKLERDLYWNNPNPSIPYTEASVNHKMDAFLGSTIDMSLCLDEMQMEENNAKIKDGNKNESYQVDYNHNEVDFKLKAAVPHISFQPPVAEPWKQSTGTFPKKPENSLAASIRKHFMNRSQEKDREAKKSLLTVDYLKPRLSEHNSTSSMKDDKKATKEVEGDDTASIDPESDDDESDVGDDSDEDDMDDSVSQRRSSLSSEDGGKEVEELTNLSLKSLPEGKSALDDNDDRPIAKKVKSNILQKAPKITATSNPRRPVKLVKIENELQKLSHKNITGRGKKSPKKRTNLGKFLKRNDFQLRSGGETEQERRNAQTRTLGLLKTSRRKSVQAMQRNARRTNYPGNAWLRQQYPHAHAHGRFLSQDTTSMTSGAEEHNKHGCDSPFGSILSVGTSIPSPKPLRFSYNAKRGRSFHLDSPSASSCLPSPSVNEEFCTSPLFEFYNSPRSRPDNLHWLATSPPISNSMPNSSQGHYTSMPFTEDLRKRLLIVHTNTPSSSTATSPIASRAHPPNTNFQNPLFNPGLEFPNFSRGQTQSDNLLMIAPHQTLNEAFTPWRENLEVIGENPAVEKETDVLPSSANVSENKASPLAEQREQIKRESFVSPLHPVSREPKSGKYIISRSKSCSDVPVSKLETPSIQSKYGKLSKKEPKMESEDSSDESEDDFLTKPESKPLLAVNKKKFDSRESSPTKMHVHWENECSEGSKTRTGRNSNNSSSKSAPEYSVRTKIPEVNELAAEYSILSQYEAAETTPLLQSDETISERIDFSKKENSDQDNIHEQKIDKTGSTSTIDDDKLSDQKTNEDDGKQITIQTTEKAASKQGPVSADQGYYSAKEENEGIAIKSGDALLKILDLTSYSSSNTGFQELSGQLIKLASIKDVEVNGDDLTSMQSDTGGKKSKNITELKEDQAQDNSEVRKGKKEEENLDVQPDPCVSIPISTDVVLDMP